ncbi:hypothetical protein KBY93_09850 [Synechococcus sp. J7-Johnson]|nr:hypothetical protein [Synechococcus sp. J7-Johnson]
MFDQLISARHHLCRWQGQLSQRMGTTRTAISRLESTRKHEHCLGLLCRYGEVVNFEPEVAIELLPH